MVLKMMGLHAPWLYSYPSECLPCTKKCCQCFRDPWYTAKNHQEFSSSFSPWALCSAFFQPGLWVSPSRRSRKNIQKAPGMHQTWMKTRASTIRAARINAKASKEQRWSPAQTLPGASCCTYIYIMYIVYIYVLYIYCILINIYIMHICMYLSYLIHVRSRCWLQLRARGIVCVCKTWAEWLPGSRYVNIEKPHGKGKPTWMLMCPDLKAKIQGIEHRWHACRSTLEPETSFKYQLYIGRSMQGPRSPDLKTRWLCTSGDPADCWFGEVPNLCDPPQNWSLWVLPSGYLT
jgi:hypothetical protein